MSAQLAISSPNVVPFKALAKGFAVGMAIVMLIGLIVADVYPINQAANEPLAATHVVGIFTGSYENGLPVYRLPPIQVTTGRKSNAARANGQD